MKNGGEGGEEIKGEVLIGDDGHQSPVVSLVWFFSPSLSFRPSFDPFFEFRFCL